MWGALTSGVLGMIGQNMTNSANASNTANTNATNLQIANATNSANTANAQKQMDFQKEMSDTSYQRGMADMKKAGLNPILAYAKGGASAPAGAMPNLQTPTMQTPSYTSPVSSFVNSAMDGQRVDNDVKRVVNETAKTNVMNDYVRAQTTHEELKQEWTLAQTNKTGSEISKIIAEANKINGETDYLKNVKSPLDMTHMQLILKDIGLRDKQVEQVISQIALQGKLGNQADASAASSMANVGVLQETQKNIAQLLRNNISIGRGIDLDNIPRADLAEFILKNPQFKQWTTEAGKITNSASDIVEMLRPRGFRPRYNLPNYGNPYP
jgi:hypothetical protein